MFTSEIRSILDSSDQIGHTHFDYAQPKKFRSAFL